ncbi:MAG: hypothetical protein ABSC06_28770 [Rhodopila sp.]|jgi:hypothetical protein
MALEDWLSGLQLRGVLVIIVRATERIIVLAEKASGASRVCRDAIDLASFFVAGAPSPVLWRRQIVAAANSLKSVNGDTLAIEAVRLTAAAGDKAYQAATAAADENLSQALGFAKQALLHVERALSRANLEGPFYRDLEKVRATHSGEAWDLGLPIDPTERGPLKFLWAPGEEPELLIAAKEAMSGRLRPNLYMAKGSVSLGDIRRQHPDFVCFYVGSDYGEGSYEGIASYIQEICSASDPIKPRPGFVVYAEKMPDADQLDLISGGAIVLTGTFAGRTLHGADQFREVLGNWLSDALLRGEQDQERTTTDTYVGLQSEFTVMSETSAKKNAPVDAEEINANYKAFLEQVKPLLKQHAM